MLGDDVADSICEAKNAFKTGIIACFEVIFHSGNLRLSWVVCRFQKLKRLEHESTKDIIFSSTYLMNI